MNKQRVRLIYFAYAGHLGAIQLGPQAGYVSSFNEPDVQLAGTDKSKLHMQCACIHWHVVNVLQLTERSNIEVTAHRVVVHVFNTVREHGHGE